MAEADAITREINRLQREYAQQREANALIESKIAALENAKHIMLQALARAEELERNANGFKIADRWEGRLAECTENTRLATKSSAVMVQNGIKKGIGEINGHIWSLRFQVNYIVKLLGGLEDSIRSLTYELYNL